MKTLALAVVLAVAPAYSQLFGVQSKDGTTMSVVRSCPGITFGTIKPVDPSPCVFVHVVSTMRDAAKVWVTVTFADGEYAWNEIESGPDAYSTLPFYRIPLDRTILHVDVEFFDSEGRTISWVQFYPIRS